MDQKKCPTCGKMNPPDAVMCWACYTSFEGGGLAGATAAATPASARPAGKPALDEHDKKKDGKPVPAWQKGVLALAVLLGLGYGGMMLMGSGSSDGESSPVDMSSMSRPFTTPDGKTARVPNASSSTPGLTEREGVPSVTLPKKSDSMPSFRVTTPPARDTDWATVGIVPTTEANAQQAAAMALIARHNLMRGRKYKGLYIYVFRDRATGAKFQRFQRARRGQPLASGDYAALSDIWPSTLVRYEYNNGNEDTRYPSQNATGWWNQAPRYTRASD